MAKWRPEGWDKNRGKTILLTSPLNEVFEAGSDAMLEALKKQGIDHKVYADHLRFGFDRGAKVLEGKEETVRYQGIKGTLVFIPDDKE
jgi:hypothetical protein